MIYFLHANSKQNKDPQRCIRPPYTTFRSPKVSPNTCLIESHSQTDKRELDISTLLLTVDILLDNCPGPIPKHILVLPKRSSIDRSIPGSIKLIEMAILGTLYEANIVELDIVVGVGCGGLALGGGGGVHGFEGIGGLEEVDAAEGVEGEGLLEELVEWGAGNYATGPS